MPAGAARWRAAAGPPTRPASPRPRPAARPWRPRAPARPVVPFARLPVCPFALSVAAGPPTPRPASPSAAAASSGVSAPTSWASSTSRRSRSPATGLRTSRPPSPRRGASRREAPTSSTPAAGRRGPASAWGGAGAPVTAGAHLVNDIWGFRHDPQVARLAAERGVPAVIMHNQRGREFQDVIGDVRAGLEASLAIAREAGLPREQLIVDPGFGFGWTLEQNLEMLRRLGELRALGLPILIGTSRKSTIGAVLGLPEGERVWGTAATVAIAIANGADIGRAPDVAGVGR